MKTQDQILTELLANPQYTTMTKMVDGQFVPMSEEERLQTFNGWAEAQYKRQIKIWPSVEYFMKEFSMQEKAAIAISQDLVIAALRLDLTTWLSSVHADDARVQAGLNKLVELGILSEARKEEIITISN